MTATAYQDRTFSVQQLENIRSANDLLEKIFKKPVAELELPIDVKSLANAIEGVRFSSELNFENLTKSGFVKVERDEFGQVRSIHIWVNPTEPPVRQRFTLAHELGHLVYDIYPHIDDSRYDEVITDSIVTLNRDENSTYRETRANRFAAQLLMPASLIQREVNHLRDVLKQEDRKISTENLLELFSSKFDVSRDAMKYRLQNLGYLK
ncbi:ImmA/IrrE family metallo-endopeptidase [Idiomarina aminovorans]|uniref:ImmA/IrrE family metallo-endopeptidase n=1 Tax=Idiomarina aminovorans TaxID=2914829 RepID=UPI0020069990|nr:ImmA/IrrE family metallo-endopeptidase [Idiomarina sp. ATCH4]MCK7459116.1 ImmA/IrrE family metallo-endopeptidase [Idiomarina sp. ATCH4]